MRRGSRRRTTRVLAAAGALALVALAAPRIAAIGGTAAPGDYPGSRDATIGGPLVSGSTSYVGGTLAWTDYAYDDKGPNTDPLPGGDTAYPSGTEPKNAADIIQTQVGLTQAGDLDVRTVLETLVHPGLPLLGVGFDTDVNALTGAPTVPGGKWAMRGKLGLERFLVISSSSTKLLAWDALQGKWNEVANFPTTVDQSANLIEVVVPKAALTPPVNGTWRAVEVAGLAVPGSTWLDGSGAIYDLAFVVGEVPNTDATYKVIDAGSQVKGQATAGQGTSTEWQDKRQSDILNGQIDASNAVGAVDFAKLRAQVTQIEPANQPGWHTHLYYSNLNYGEGIQTAGGGIRYAGPYEPYGVKLPSAGVLAQPSVPLLFFMHGANENHLQNYVAFEQSLTADIASPSHFDPPAIVTFGLGRDPSWDTGPAEQDMVDVIADIGRRYTVDADRTWVSGISAGGMGTFRMAELHPDWFAGAFSLVGADGTGMPGNLINTPLRMQNGMADPLVNPALWIPTIQAFDARGDVDYMSFQNGNRSHTHVPALGNCVYLDFIRRGRVVNPARVVYGVDPANEVDDAATGLHIKHAGAYWVSGMDRRDAGAAGDIDAVSLARADRKPAATSVEMPHNNVVEGGADYCGPNKNVVTGDTWNQHGITLGTGAAQPTSNGATVKLTNLSAAALDLIRMSLSTTAPLTIDVTGDGSSALALTGPWHGPVSVTKDGTPAGTLNPSGNTVTLSDHFTGTHTYVLTP